MRVAVVGGGLLGLTLALRLARRGDEVEVLEAADRWGGLSAPFDYGPFVWDRFYHCILPQDRRLLALIDEIGLTDRLRWRRTGTGYYSGGVIHPMTTMRDQLRFPLLSLWEKIRLAGAVSWAGRFARPDALYEITAEEWLTRLCGRRVYERFWRPLLRAKFGDVHREVAAVFIHATLARLMGARRGVAHREKLGYVRGGYRAILDALIETLGRTRTRLRLSTPVRRIERVVREDGTEACEVRYEDASGWSTGAVFDRVYFTAPTRLAADLVGDPFGPVVERAARRHPTGERYLGVVCTALVLDRPLTDSYILNIADESIELTGLIEMTNLIDPAEETAGRHLVYLPRYVDAADPLLDAPDDAVRAMMIERGLSRLWPELPSSAIEAAIVHRARYVQPLPLAATGAAAGRSIEPVDAPLKIVNTSMLRCATLNNDEVIGLADAFLEAESRARARSAQRARRDREPVPA